MNDRVLGRRQSWDGAAVKDLTRHGTNPYYGRYYRVAESGRNPETGAWGIRWDLDKDEIARPDGEPIYLFDGATWDLPAEASTVFPKTAFIVLASVAGFFTVTAPMFWSDSMDSTGVVIFAWAVVIVMTGWSWFYSIEPVRGTKVGAVITAASAARSAQNKRESAERIADFNKHSGILNHIREMDPKEARRLGYTPEDL